MPLLEIKNETLSDFYTQPFFYFYRNAVVNNQCDLKIFHVALQYK